MPDPTRAVLASFLAAALLAGATPGGAASQPRRLFRSLPRSLVRTHAVPARPSSRSTTSSPAALLAQVEEQLALRRQRLAQVKEEERVDLERFSGAQERLQRAIVQLNHTTSALASTQHAVADASRTLEAVSGHLSDQASLMGARVRAFYERGPLGYMDVILGAADFRDFITRSYLVALVVERDLVIYHEVAAERQQQAEVTDALAAKRAQLGFDQQRWIASEQETARLAAERRRLLEHVQAERASEEAAIRELQAESVRIAEIIRRTAQGSNTGPVPTLRAGALRWPVPGAISSGYGWRIHPIFHTREFHTGIDIAAPYGTPIRAARDGTVIFNGWMRGYGMLVILDHGNGLSTTYAHLSSSSVRVGERVKRGEVIANIGSTGWSTGPHLFFEVREDGQPVNPLGQ